MFFSIITVCHNAEKTIEKTILSVKNQTCKDFEHIFIDGASQDGTLPILNSYQNSYPMKIYSEPDLGIYNAMNKAIQHATGRYLYFLNSGDSLWDSSVLYKVKVVLEKHEADILFGNICFITKNGDRMYSSYHKRIWLQLYISLGYTICHQALFSKKTLFAQHEFDESFRFWADQEWLMYQLSHHRRVMTWNEIIAVYPLDGVSSDKNNLSCIRKESDCISHRYMPVLFYIIFPLKCLIRLFKR